ncbi:MAG: ATP-binding cassette domain-containing protein, partial [Ignavibacteria bacterium]
NKENAVKPSIIKGEIEFKNVWFAYNEGEWVLKDVSFKINPGETAAIVGATGAGKTSIISILTRFYDIQKGQILIDGIDIREIDKEELRKFISIVLQDVFLFSGTIKSNINLNDESISMEKIKEAAKIVGADKFIEKLPNKYDEEVKEKGATLSVGQKQLISFARALVFKPQILILDEATSSVDTETEILIQKAIEKMLKGRTSIVIAHRLSTIQSADKILVMHKGELKEKGTHQELLAQRGIYYRLYQLQYKDQELTQTA